MKILIVAATEAEISLLKQIDSSGHQLDFVVTGPGMVATTYFLSKKLFNNNFDLAIDCGIAGSFERSLQIGEVVNVIEDYFSELGAEDGEEFLDLKEMGLDGTDRVESTFHFAGLDYLHKAKGITVNTVHGNDKRIEEIKKRNKADIETMEGAAFFLVCVNEKVPSIQIRAISNYIERRNKSLWNIPLALQNLKITLEKIISEIE